MTSKASDLLKPFYEDCSRKSEGRRDSSSPPTVDSLSNPPLSGSSHNVISEGGAREDFGSWIVWTDELEHIDREGKLLAERLAYLRERRRQVKQALADLGVDGRRAA